MVKVSIDNVAGFIHPLAGVVCNGPLQPASYILNINFDGVTARTSIHANMDGSMVSSRLRELADSFEANILEANKEVANG